MKKIILICFLFFGLHQLFASSTKPIAVSKEIKGRLVDFKTRGDADEVEVSLRSKKSNKTWIVETDNDGYFIFNNIPLGACELSIIDKSYRPEKFQFVTDTNHREKFHFSTPFYVNLKVTWLFNWGDKTVYVNGKKTIKEHYWSHITAKVILGLYGFCLLLILTNTFLQINSKYLFLNKTPGTKPVSTSI